MQYKDYWNEVHQKYSQGEIVYYNWLDSYKSILDGCKTAVLDLGCGIWNDTLYLTEKGFRVIACDYSDVALDKIKKTLIMWKPNFWIFQRHCLLLIVLLI